MSPPTTPFIDIFARGNAIVDVLSHIDDTMIDGLPANKEAMTLIGAVEAQQMYSVLGPGVKF